MRVFLGTAVFTTSPPTHLKGGAGFEPTHGSLDLEVSLKIATCNNFKKRGVHFFSRASGNLRIPIGLLNSARIPPSLIKEHFLSGKQDSNLRPAVWKTAALPTELLPHLLLYYFLNDSTSFAENGCLSITFPNPLSIHRL